ncbi:Di-copper centre-containing protein [Lentinus brumalis]|uniref:Di-copper centre-containing protein n=1 Tax=Lentinus brumalis TaxID=2498619 RepID=A0A371CVT1_9APHY|nr:Di-copper centre-containing protein [Polyporus brumalis]
MGASIHRDTDHDGHGHDHDGHDHECTRRSATVRREWCVGAMPKHERREYIAAVHCLKRKPSKFEPGVVPAAKSLYDDFVAVHINKTLSVHTSGIFLVWHREFVHLYEHALRTECDYHGTQPYWDWPRWAHDLAGSPLFDGSDTSLSGDGAYNASQGPYEIKPGVTLPRGTGGGCVLGGPFVNHTVNFGPFDTALAFDLEMPPNWQADTSRCLVRDLNTHISSRFGNQQVVDRLLSGCNIEEFQGNLTSFPTTLKGFGPHGGGHLSLGDTMADFFASPADPAFYLHHAQVDRMYTIWQKIDPEHRRYALNGTLTFGYKNDTPEATVDTILDWGVLGKPKKIGEIMDPMGGDYCYRYE